MTLEGDTDPHESEYPPGYTIDPEIQAFIKNYYTQVDRQGSHVAYSECWAKNGVLIVPSGTEFRGRDAIKNVHLGMWEGVPKRLHRPTKVFPFGDHADEVMILGNVTYWPEKSPEVQKGMAAHARYERDGESGMLKLSSLQVWLTS